MFYPEELVNEIREKSDIVEVISPYVSLTKRGENYLGLCPFHREKTPSFTVNRNKQIFYCFGCGVGGNVYSFLMKYENKTFVEAIEEQAKRLNIDLPKTSYAKEDASLRKERETYLEIYKKAATLYYHALRDKKGSPAMEYLKNRGLGIEIINRFGLGYAGNTKNWLYNRLKEIGYSDEVLIKSKIVGHDEGRGVFDVFWNRVMFPIMDINNRVIGFGGRVLADTKPKYINSMESLIFNKRKNLYGLNFAKNSREGYFFICEGYMDVISLHKADFTNSVASLGTALTEDQARLISRYVKKVILVYDSDEAGIKATLRAIPIFEKQKIRLEVLNLSPAKDPDEFLNTYGRGEFLKRVERATPSFEFETEILQKQYNLERPDEKTEFANRLAERISEFEEEIERDNYIEAVSRKYNFSINSFKRLVNRFGLSNLEKEKYKEIRKEADEDIIQKPETNRLELAFLWLLLENTELYSLIRGRLNECDFTDRLCKKIAKQIFEKFENKEVVDLSEMMKTCDTEEQSLVASMAMEDNGIRSEDFEKAFREMALRIKKDSLERSLKEAVRGADNKTMLSVIKEQKEIEKGLFFNAK